LTYGIIATNYRDIRFYSTSRDENLVEITIKAIADIILFKRIYLKLISEPLFKNNKFDFKDPSLSEKEQDLLEIYTSQHKYKEEEIKNFCFNHLKKSEKYREFVIKCLNYYNVILISQVLLENPFVGCGYLQSVKKYLKYSNLKLFTLHDFCKNVFSRYPKNQQEYKIFLRYLSEQFTKITPVLKGLQLNFNKYVSSFEEEIVAGAQAEEFFEDLNDLERLFDNLFIIYKHLNFN
jgi:hypothetical protein